MNVLTGFFALGREASSQESPDVPGWMAEVFRVSPLGIALVRRGGRVVRSNPALDRMFGLPDGGLEGNSFVPHIHPEDLEGDANEARRLIRGAADGYVRENRYRRADGSVFRGRQTVSLVPGDEARLHAVVMVEDIDDRKRAEAGLSLFRAVMESSREAVCILSPAGHLLYANSAFGELFERPHADVVGSHYREYFAPEAVPALDAALGPALRRGEGWEGVLEAIDGAGRRFPLRQRAGVVRDEEGRVRFYFAFMHDHSDQQAFEDQLLDAKEAAEEANIAKTRFLAAASHDLRQPLQALAMFVEVLSGRLKNTIHAGLVERIHDSVLALEGLLNSLLDVSKLEAGLVVAHEEVFTAGPVLDRLAAEFAPLCREAGLTLSVVPCGVAVRSDSTLLERILRNLLANALRYTPSGRILLGCRRAGRFLRIEVWDTGIGIPATELKAIFREFHQVGNSNRDRNQGLGLGLAIVERLARLLGHAVDVRSVEGRGSVFSVSVPIVERARRPAPKPRQLALGLMQKGAAVVAIDDEPEVLESLRMLLESWGHRVLAAPSADEAIRRLPELGGRPDLIVADYRLRDEETGGKAIARIEERLGMRLPAIILTGDTAPERLRQAQALGHFLLHKPVQPDDLRSAIDQALAKGERSRRRAARAKGDPGTRKAGAG